MLHTTYIWWLFLPVFQCYMILKHWISSVILWLLHSFLSYTPSTNLMRWVCSRQRGLRSIVHSDVPEQVGHGLVILDTPDCLHQHDADVHCFDFVTLHFLDLVWDCVSYNYLQANVISVTGIWASLIINSIIWMFNNL